MSTISVPDLESLLDSWALALRADRRSPSTIDSYLRGVRALLRWCAAEGRPAVLDRPTVRAWVAGLLDGGAEPNTARSRQMAVKRFSAWLAEEDEIDRDELLGLKPPKLDVKVVDRLTEDQCAALVKACAGKSFLDRRDEALLRVLLETGLRAGEALALHLDDLNLPAGLLRVRRGKGGKGRQVPIGPQTCRALDRYLRARNSHRLKDTPALWLGGGGQSFGYNAADKALKARARTAGIDNFHIHLT
ncbi:MAG: integrase, partial [Mycobacterium sp.]|nr:integrase [Mycobacterium sp.]